MLKMTHLQKVYRTHLIETYALRDFSINVREGEFGRASCRERV